MRVRVRLSSLACPTPARYGPASSVKLINTPAPPAEYRRAHHRYSAHRPVSLGLMAPPEDPPLVILGAISPTPPRRRGSSVSPSGECFLRRRWVLIVTVILALTARRMGATIHSAARSRSRRHRERAADGSVPSHAAMQHTVDDDAASTAHDPRALWRSFTRTRSCRTSSRRPRP